MAAAYESAGSYNSDRERGIAIIAELILVQDAVVPQEDGIGLLELLDIDALCGGRHDLGLLLWSNGLLVVRDGASV